MTRRCHTEGCQRAAHVGRDPQLIFAFCTDCTRAISWHGGEFARRLRDREVPTMVVGGRPVA